MKGKKGKGTKSGIEITKGVVIRGLKSANSEPFSSEDLDEHNRLQDASVNCIQDSKDKDIPTIMIGMNPNMIRHGHRSTTVEKIIQKGGKVIKDPDLHNHNRNHCIIFGLTLADANNLFSS